MADIHLTGQKDESNAHTSETTKQKGKVRQNTKMKTQNYGIRHSENDKSDKSEQINGQDNKLKYTTHPEATINCHTAAAALRA